MHIGSIYCGLQINTYTGAADDNILWCVFIYNRTEVHDIRVYRFNKIHTGSGGAGS